MGELSERVASAKTPGRRLRLARELAGLSLGDAGRAFDCSAAQISGEELGERELTALRIWKLADYYGVSSRWAETGAAHGSDKLPEPEREIERLREIMSAGGDQ